MFDNCGSGVSECSADAADAEFNAAEDAGYDEGMLVEVVCFEEVKEDSSGVTDFAVVGESFNGCVGGYVSDGVAVMVCFFIDGAMVSEDGGDIIWVVKVIEMGVEFGFFFNEFSCAEFVHGYLLR